jgi:phosphoribosylamine--glycine ligase
MKELMNVLLISKDLYAADLCLRLMREGHRVKVYVEDQTDNETYVGMIRRVQSWKKELKWVGKEGLIIFDNTGYGKIQDELRKMGYAVIGGSEAGDRCEDDRAFGQRILWASGVKIVPSQDFHSLNDAIAFVRKHPDEWVIKQNGHASKVFNYVGQMKDGSDVISMLESYRKRGNKKDVHSIELQKRIRGVEIGVARYFNGEDWVGPIEMNMEHKDLHNNNLGPKTFEMGPLMWFDTNEKNKLFLETLAKLKPYLKRINFRGDIDINCIVNETGAYPLEFTARFGYPALQLQCALAVSPFGEFLKAVADGRDYNFQYRKGFGIVVLVATPPFPYQKISKENFSKGVNIYFKGTLTDEEKNHIHFERVSRRRSGEYYISKDDGFVLHVSGTGSTVEQARNETYSLIHKLIIPKMFYRTDIGVRFIKEERTKLKKWGYL